MTKMKLKRFKLMKTSDVTRRVFDSATSDIREMTAQHGFVARLVRELEARTGVKWHRQHIEMWLDPDARKRIEPRFGAGALLIQTARELNQRMKYERESTNDQAVSENEARV